jgi:hypothetical protein
MQAPCLGLPSLPAHRVHDVEALLKALELYRVVQEHQPQRALRAQGRLVRADAGAVVAASRGWCQAAP